MLRAAQAWNGLAQPQLRAAYSSLRLKSRVLRSQSGNGIGRGQDSGMSIVAFNELWVVYGLSNVAVNHLNQSMSTFDERWTQIVYS